MVPSQASLATLFQERLSIGGETKGKFKTHAACIEQWMGDAVGRKGGMEGARRGENRDCCWVSVMTGVVGGSERRLGG